MLRQEVGVKDQEIIRYQQTIATKKQDDSTRKVSIKQQDEVAGPEHAQAIKVL